jgi:hypothetical protein
MAALTGSQVVKAWTEGETVKVVVYSLRDCSGSDTVDVSAELRRIVAGTLVTVESQTAAAIGGAGTTTAGLPSGPSHDVGWLTVWGIPA